MKLKSGGLAATTALAGSIAFGGLAVAADLDGTPTRNWGGTWFGFGAGYAKQSYKGNFDSQTCATGASTTPSSTGQLNAESVCRFDGNSLTTRASTSYAGDQGQVISSSDGSSIAGPGTATGFSVSSVSGFLSNGSLAGVGSATFIAPVPGEGFVATGASGGNGSIGIEQEADARSEGGSPTTITPNPLLITNGDTSGVTTTAANVQLADSVSGIVAGNSLSSLNVGGERADAFALGIGGLPTDLSGSDGGFAGSIHVRRDYQGESNWVFGGELDMTWTPDNNVRLSDYVQASDENFEASFGRRVEATSSLMASARLRAGYAMGDYLLYGTGGIAYTEFEATNTLGLGYSAENLTINESLSESKSGHAWGGVVGGGVSAFMNDDTVVSLEGLYYMFDKTIGFQDGSVKLDDAFSVMVKVSIRPN